jgi:hypothetical protein
MYVPTSYNRMNNYMVGTILTQIVHYFRCKRFFKKVLNYCASRRKPLFSMKELHITYLRIFVHNCWGAFPQMCEETETKNFRNIQTNVFKI